MAADLIQDPFLVAGQKAQSIHLGKRLRHERLGEIQALVGADDVFDAPVDPFRCCQRVLITVVVLHDPSSVIFSAQRRWYGTIARTMPKPRQCRITSEISSLE